MDLHCSLAVPVYRPALLSQSIYLCYYAMAFVLIIGKGVDSPRRQKFRIETFIKTLLDRVD